jgi:hypothetical protein
MIPIEKYDLDPQLLNTGLPNQLLSQLPQLSIPKCKKA